MGIAAVLFSMLLPSGCRIAEMFIVEVADLGSSCGNRAAGNPVTLKKYEVLLLLVGDSREWTTSNSILLGSG